jgi:adenosylcobyric acid synthase
VPSAVSFAAERERQLDALVDLIADHLDTRALWRLIEEGAPSSAPFIPPGAP